MSTDNRFEALERRVARLEQRLKALQDHNAKGEYREAKGKSADI